MAKSRTIYICQNCGNESSKWIGKCPVCHEWNTYSEETIVKESKKGPAGPRTSSKPTPISEIKPPDRKRISTSNKELDRLLGGGLVPGSLVLLGGEPGIGKSTMALQMVLDMKDINSIYISGEESEQQLKLRAERIGGINQDSLVYCETRLEDILRNLEEVKPSLVIVDSVQTMYTERLESSPGSVSQLRESAALLLKYAKESGVPVILIGHITKDGSIAGPKLLEHIVDTVLYFEGDRNHLYRILRASKNRFGSTNELGIFEMYDKGLREIENPSEMLISHFEEELSGVSIAATMDGIRPFLIEIQALVSSAVYGTPQRSSTGFDLRRLNMLLAVLEKRAGFRLGSKDVFLNIAGGIKVNDTATDLAVISSVMSSNLDHSIDKKICFSAEVGLSGEIRPVSRIEQRVAEAAKLGFEKIFISKYNTRGLKLQNPGIEIIGVDKIESLVKKLY